MSLATALSTEFSSKVRKRGQAYFTGGAVEIIAGSAQSLEAWVYGTVPYQVGIVLDDPVVTGSCTCPYYVDRVEPCKHLWAVLLTAAAKGFLGGMATPRRRDLYLDLPESDSGPYDPASLHEASAPGMRRPTRGAATQACRQPEASALARMAQQAWLGHTGRRSIANIGTPA